MAAYSPETIFVRWAGFVSAIWMMQLCGGYTFSNYSTALKEVLSINQKQLNTLSLAKDVGDALGILGGVTSNYAPAWVLLMIGAAVSFLGYGAQWLVVSQTINPLPYWMMLIAAGMAGNAITWINTGTFTVSMKNFPRNRGPVSGLLKAYMGLAAAIYSMLGDFLFSSSSSYFLLMLTILPTAACIISAFLFRPVPPAATGNDEKDETRSVFLFNMMAVALALYLTVCDFFSPNNALLRKAFLGVLFLLMILPIYVPLHFLLRRENAACVIQGSIQHTIHTPTAPDKDNESTLEKGGCDGNGSLDQEVTTTSLKEPLLKAFSNEGPVVSSGKSMNEELELSADQRKKMLSLCKERGCYKTLPELGKERSTLQLLRSWDFFVFFLTCLCAAGSGMALSNNLGQVGQALGFDSVTVFTSLFSLGNFGGRILSGVTSEYFLRKAAVPRSVWMGLAKLPMIGMFFWLATGSETSLYVGTFVLGMCHGLHISLMIPMVSEFYGLKNFGTNLTVSGTVLLLGSFLFSKLLAGILYDREAAKQEKLRQKLGWLLQSSSSSSSSSSSIILTPRHFISSSDETLTCYGPECYRLTFIIIAVLLIVATGLDVILTIASRPLYKKLQEINTASDKK